MSTELTYLALTALLASALWIPYIVGVSKVESDNPNADFLRPRDLKTVPEWVHRAHRAHLNLLEQFLPLAVLVLIAAQLNISTTIMAWSVALFFWIRVMHAIGMVSGIARLPLRPLIFLAGWICILVFAWQLFANA